LTQYQRVTDEQTGGRTIDSTALCIASYMLTWCKKTQLNSLTLTV